MPRIAVLGLSAFGKTLVRALAEERCRVLAVDVDEARVNSVREWVDEAIIADARDLRSLEALRLADYDAVVVSLGEPLDASLLAVLHLRDLKVRRIIAKAVTEDHRRLLRQLGVDEAVFPEADMAGRTAHTLAHPGYLETVHLGEAIAIAEIAPPEKIIGKMLAELELRQEFGITVVAIRDSLRDQVEVTPDPHRRITDSDSLIVLGRQEDVDRFLR